MIRCLNANINIINESKSFVEKTAPCEYTLSIADKNDFSVIAHELWHIYLDILVSNGLSEDDIKTLPNEIYAYTFGNLVKDIMNCSS